MKSLLAVMSALCLLAACTNPNAAYEKRRTLERDREVYLSGWIGFRETQLVNQWGPPTRVYEAAGKRYLIYSRSHIRSYTSVAGNPVVWTAYCDTTMTSIGGVIEGWRFKGNDCVNATP